MAPMTEREYITLCNDSDFEAWFKTRCCNNSFKNIEDRKSFRILMFNKEKIKEASDAIDGYCVFLINYKDNLKILRDCLINTEDDDFCFFIEDDTFFFPFTYPDQLRECEFLKENCREHMIKLLREADEE